MTTASKFDCDVAIVGLGPVGITLACLLAKAGHTVVGLDAAQDVYEKPRAISLDHETLRTWQGLGVADRMAPSIGDYKPTEYRAADGQVLRRFVATPPPYPLAWPPNLFFIQPEVERALRDHARGYPSLSLRLGAQVTALAGEESTPVLSVRDVATGVADRLTAHFVVGCDGAASLVRKSLAIPSEDLDFDEPWLVVDVLVSDQARLPEIIIQKCDPARPTTFVRGPRNLRRWEFMLLPGEDPAEMVRPERIRALLRDWLEPDHAEIWRAATYRFHALVAERWRVGRVLLAGDAAHQTPPFIGQGLNQGIRDAANLGWKLSAVLRGSPEGLLDTYEAERRPNVRAVIGVTKELGRLICERDPVAAEARDRAMLTEVAAGQGTRIRQSLLPPIRQGLIARDAAGEPLPGAGETCPQPWVATPAGRHRLDDRHASASYVLVSAEAALGMDCVRAATDVVGRILLVRSAGRACDGVIEGLPAGAREFVELDRVVTEWLAGRGIAAVLVRPDHIVFGGVATPAQLVSLILEYGERISGARSV